ncbi:MAG TPA: NAD(P)/FAD-dependent oxidoreductase [Capillimicrobium sp.]|nr:NAD(P)/FAD-dependent oxidoreductase [Capillimicrobium sp.]
MQDYDAVVVGASLAGCTTAILLGRAGVRVGLVERSPKPDAFKRVCSHHIQSSGVPTLERLGLRSEIEAAGAAVGHLRVHSEWGWISVPETTDAPPCLNIRREVLDPMIRRLAAETPNVDLLPGLRVTELIHDGGRVAGVVASDRSAEPVRLRAPLVVGADGRDSTVAALAKVPAKDTPHGRIAYGGYWKGPAIDGAPNPSVWFLDPQWVAAFPTDSGLTFYAAMPTRDQLPRYKADPQRTLVEEISRVPDAPPIAESECVSPVIGKLDMTNHRRRAAQPGLALVGDAALAIDPLWGVGCGWALQSGEWLADAVAPALRGEAALDPALERYRRRHARELGGYARLMEEYASGRKLNAGERFVFQAAALDDRAAERFEAFGTRRMKPLRYFATAIPEAIAVHARARLGGRRARPAEGVA